MALAFNSATKKWERSTTAPVASSIPKAPTTVQQPTPVTYTQQTDPAKAKISSIWTVSWTVPTPTPKAVAQPIQTQPITTPEQNQASQQQAYDFIWAPKQPTTPVPTQEPTQPTTPELWAPAQEERVWQSRTEEQQLQDDIAKTQEEVNNLKNREDALWQAEYLKKMKELQEYQNKQKEITDKQKAMSEEQAQIQSSAKLREAQRSLSQLKRNTAYLSSQGLWQSAGALDAFSQQISNAEQTFKEMQQYEQYAEEMRKLGYDFDANAYERGMKEQQDELDKYVSDTIQTIFNNMSAAEMAGQMDTVDEVDAFATKYFNSIDTDIANMTRKQIQIAEQKQALQVQQLAEVKAFVANKSVINKDMSAAQGYYVDGNGAPIISATTGSFIPMPQDPPMEPIRDAKTGKLVSFSLWEDWSIVADVQQVIDQPTFSSNTIQNMVQAVANWTMTVWQAMEVLPPDAQQQFLDKIWSVRKQTETTIPQLQETRVVENADGTKTTYQRNPATNAFDKPVWTNYQTPSGVPIQDAIALAISKCATGAQCGKFVNDVLEATGQPRLVKDSFESKVQAIQTIGEAYSMEDVGAGSIFTYPVSWSSYWHIGIVTAVNADGTINIMDYNYNNDEKQRERTNVNPSEILGKWGYLSKPIITEQNVPKQEWWDLNKLADFIIDTQPRWQGYSDWDVKAFTDAVKKYAAAGDKDTVIQLYRDQLLRKPALDTLYRNTVFIAETIGQTQDLMKQYEANWGDMNIFNWNVQKVQEKLWSSWNDLLLQIGQNLWMMTADYIRSISGTAASDKEVQRLINLLPNTTSTFQRNILLSDWFKNRIKTEAKSALWVAMGKNKWMVDEVFYELWWGTNATPNSTQQTTQQTQGNVTVHPSLLWQAR
jgi:hypothetical protein